jgi:hypothetical protein
MHRFGALSCTIALCGCSPEPASNASSTENSSSDASSASTDESEGSGPSTSGEASAASDSTTRADTSTTESTAATAATSSEAGDPPAYDPLVVLDFEEGADEQDAGWPATTGGPVAFDTTQAHSGATSARVSFQHLQNGFGGYQDLPESIGPGETVWYRVYLYMPSTLSLSYGDVSGDGFGWNKFLVLSQLDHEAPRMYVQPRSAYMVDFGDPGFAHPGLYVNHDGLGEYCPISKDSYAFPRDQWFALQMAWHVATDDTAWVRVWSDDTFLGECAGGGAVPDGYTVQSWGIGDYWNGGAWIQNGSTADFWVDDVVVSKQTPTTTDAGGRPYISPDDFW